MRISAYGSAYPSSKAFLTPLAYYGDPHLRLCLEYNKLGPRYHSNAPLAVDIGHIYRTYCKVLNLSSYIVCPWQAFCILFQGLLALAIVCSNVVAEM